MWSLREQAFLFTLLHSEIFSILAFNIWSNQTANNINSDHIKRQGASNINQDHIERLSLNYKIEYFAILSLLGELIKHMLSNCDHTKRVLSTLCFISKLGKYSLHCCLYKIGNKELVLMKISVILFLFSPIARKWIHFHFSHHKNTSN